MTRDLKPMYCRLDGIWGMDEEKAHAERLLGRLKGKPGIVVLGLDDPDWVYGQATFAYEGGSPFKFVDRFSTVASNGALHALVNAGKPSAILFVDTKLKSRFESHRAFSALTALFRQVMAFKAGEPTGGFFATVRRVLKSTFTPTPSKDEATSCREGVEIHATRLMHEQDPMELLRMVMGLYHYCSLDKARETLEARIRERPDDGLGHMGLTLLLSDFGDHPAALAQARRSTAFSQPSVEALLWHGKEAWWAEEASEGLQSIARIAALPSGWPATARRSVHVIRAALLALRDDAAGAVQAFERAIEVDGSSVALHLCLCHVLQDAGRLDEALAAADNAIVISPDNAMVQVERCRILSLKRDGVGLERALRKLRLTQRGALETLRFESGPGAVGLKVPQPPEFALIDVQRRHALLASLMPTWLDLIDGEAVKTLYGLFLQDAHRGEKEYAKQLCPAFKSLDDDPLDPVAQTAVAATWILLERPDLACLWSQSAVALAPDLPAHHWLHCEALQRAEKYNEAFDAAARARNIGQANEDVEQTLQVLMWSIPRLDEMGRWLDTPARRERLQADAQTYLDKPGLRPAALMALSLLACESDPSTTIRLQSEALQLKPDVDDFHGALIASLKATGRLAESEEAVEHRATAMLRRHPDGDVEKFAGFAERLLTAGHLDLAQACARAGLQLSPESQRLQVAHGRILLAQGDSERAISELTRIAFASSPFSAPAAHALGDALDDLGRRDEALGAWTRLQQCAPQDAAAFLGAGVSLWLLDRDSEAADMVAQATKLDDSNPYAWGLLGRILKGLARDEEAVVALERALSFKRPPKRALRSLVSCLVSTGRAREAKTLCDDAIARGASNAEAATGLVEVLCSLGQRDQALNWGRSWMEFPGATVDELVGMRDAIEKHVGFAAALDVGDASLARYPAATELLVDQAWGLAKLGDFPAALNLARKATELMPDAASPLRALCHVCAHCGSLDTEEASALSHRLVSSGRTPYTLRLAADVLRAGRVDARPAYEEALLSASSQQAANEHAMAWCLLHLGRLQEAAGRMESHVLANPDPGSSTIDRAVIGYLASDGDQGWVEELRGAVFATKHLERRKGWLAELRELVPQWKFHELAPAGRLDAMLETLEASAGE